jgi:hypothetical protein
VSPRHHRPGRGRRLREGVAGLGCWFERNERSAPRHRRFTRALRNNAKLDRAARAVYYLRFYASRAHATSASQGRSNPRRRLRSSASARAAKRFAGIRGEQRKHRQALAEFDVLRVVDEASVPADGGAVELLGLRVGEQERQLECFGKPDEAELGGGRQRFGDVAAIAWAAFCVYLSNPLRRSYKGDARTQNGAADDPVVTPRRHRSGHGRRVATRPLVL